MVNIIDIFLTPCFHFMKKINGWASNVTLTATGSCTDAAGQRKYGNQNPLVSYFQRSGDVTASEIGRMGLP